MRDWKKEFIELANLTPVFDGDVSENEYEKKLVNFIETLLEEARRGVVEGYEGALRKSIPRALLTYEEYWNLTHEEAHEAAEPFMQELTYWADKYLTSEKDKE